MTQAGAAGALCWQCLEQFPHDPIHSNAYDDPAVHPEWRIDRLPHDFTRLPYLMPAIAAWVSTHDYPIIHIEWLPSRHIWSARYQSASDAPSCWAYHCDHTTAEWQALAGVIHAEQTGLLLLPAPRLNSSALWPSHNVTTVRGKTRITDHRTPWPPDDNPEESGSS